jgi:hypothetical protein
MSAMREVVRKLNLNGSTTPAVLGAAQSVVRSIGATEIAAAARWGGVVGLVAFWFVEPYDFIRSLREGPEDAN